MNSSTHTYIAYPFSRKALSPTFSSGKLKGMLDLLEESMDKMIEYIEKNVDDNSVATVKAKNMFQLMALDVIAKVSQPSY